MAFISISELSDIDYLSCRLCGIYAVDTERHLCLTTTDGRTRNARRWFVQKMEADRYKPNWTAGRVTFRAWTLKEALETLESKRVQNRIGKQWAADAMAIATEMTESEG